MEIGDAKVLGNVDYQSSKDISIRDEATVSGAVNRTDPPDRNTNFSVTWGWVIYWLLATLFTGLILVLLFPRVFQSVTNKAYPRPWKALGVGLLAVIAAPVIFVLLMFTVVGIPVALLLGLIWIIVLILSSIFSSYLVGRWLLKDSGNVVLTMLGGVAVLVIAGFIPYIGPLITFFAFLVGVGMITMETINRTPKPVYSETKKKTNKK